MLMLFQSLMKDWMHELKDVVRMNCADMMETVELGSTTDCVLTSDHEQYLLESGQLLLANPCLALFG